MYGLRSALCSHVAEPKASLPSLPHPPSLPLFLLLGKIVRHNLNAACGDKIVMRETVMSALPAELYSIFFTDMLVCDSQEGFRNAQRRKR